jgi:sugar lactone lactonase YvrE
MDFGRHGISQIVVDPTGAVWKPHRKYRKGQKTMLSKFARTSFVLTMAAALFSFEACKENKSNSAEQTGPAQQPSPVQQIPSGKDVLYVSNFNANTITLYDANTGALLGTLLKAGPELKGINGFDIAADGSFYVAGQDTNNVVHYSKTGQLLEALDSANTAGVSAPQGVTFGPDGMLYVASLGNGKVVRYDTERRSFKDAFTTVSVQGIAKPMPIEPRFDSDGNLTVSTFEGGRILKYQGPRTEALNSITAGSATRKPAAKPGTLLLTYKLPSQPSAGSTPTAALAALNTAYASGTTLASATTLTSAPSAAAAPKKRIFIDAVNPKTLVGEIQEFLDDGTFVSHFIPNGTGGLVLPGGISMGPDGKLYVANVRVDANFKDIGSQILRFDPKNGQFLGVFIEGKGLDVPFVMRFQKTQ